jgi:hypothetical protein
MRELIRKILKEQFPHDGTSDEKYNYVQKKLDQFERTHPFVEKWFESKWGDKLKLKGSIRDTYLGSDSMETQSIQYDIYIEDESLNPQEVKKEVIYHLKNVFDMNFTLYGEPINIKFYKKSWKEF